ncbi:MAG: ATP phosphoribosyltransferase regulatory subunit [Anaerolineae bacterium]|nr:ATP phosphoribosyltransferase regulatory subunit [Anaerolineae bacterium]
MMWKPPATETHIVMLNRQYDLTNSLMQHMRLFGYEVVNLPILDSADIFLIKAGDQVINRLFTFERHGKEWALRPEFTAQATYHYISQKQLDFVARWQFNGHIFEDTPNNGRQYQQFSIGAELIGANTPSADAEIIAVAAQGIAAQGIEDWHLVIGHTGLLRQILNHFQLDLRTQQFLLHHLPALNNPDQGKKFVLEQLDRLLVQHTELLTEMMLEPVVVGVEIIPAMGTRTRQDIAKRLFQKRQRSVQRSQVVAALDFLEIWHDVTGIPDDAFAVLNRLVGDDDTNSRHTLEDWWRVVNLLKLYDIPSSKIIIQPDLARSWEYYTGIVFELHASGLHLGGGGRYDELAQLIGGKQNVPAVGFAYYIDNFLAALPYHSLLEQKTVLNLMATNQDDAVLWAQRLRRHGLPVQIVSSVADDKNVLIAQNQSTLHWQTNVYQIDQINTLVTNIKNLP